MAFVTRREPRSGKGKNRRTDHCPARRYRKRHDTHAVKAMLLWRNLHVPLQQKKIHEWANTFLLVGVQLCQKSRSHVRHHAFLQALPLRGRASKGSELHIGMRKWRKIEIPKWNINNKDSGRSDDRTCRRIPFKNTQSDAAAFKNMCLCCSAQRPCFLPFPPPHFYQFLPGALLSRPSAGPQTTSSAGLTHDWSSPTAQSR